MIEALDLLLEVKDGPRARVKQVKPTHADEGSEVPRKSPQGLTVRVLQTVQQEPRDGVDVLAPRRDS